MTTKLKPRKRRLTKAEVQEKLKEWQRRAIQEVARPDFALRWVTRPVTAAILVALAEQAEESSDIPDQEPSTGSTGSN